MELVTPTIQFYEADLGSVAFGDYDNDGDQDLITIGKGGPVKTVLYSNNGSGVFTEVTGMPFTNVFYGKVAFEDVNNDGFKDLFITGSTSSPTRTAKLYFNNGMGGFTEATGTSFEPNSTGDFEFADIDNDGDKDLLMTGTNTSDLSFTKLYTNNGLGIFSLVSGTTFEPVRESSIAFFDMDNDGDKDVIISGKNNSYARLTKLYANNGSGLFTLVANTTFDAVSLCGITAGDSDNDGDIDILITGQSDSGYISKLYLNNGAGIFSVLSGTPFEGVFISTANFADFDNDGDKDIFIAGARIGNPSAMASIYQNQGNNTFVLSNSLIATYQARVGIADIDNDGDLDLFLAGTHFEGGVRVPKLYRNTTILSITNFDTKNITNFYPNPTNDIVNFKSSENIEKITIYNLLGQVVFSKEMNSNEFMLDISNQNTGTYIAKMTANGKSESVKLLKL